MRIIYRSLISAHLLLAVILTGYAHAEENCNAWRTADIDPTAGAYILELRTCDLTYGLSAYVQIRNSSDKRLQLMYRLTTKDEKNKDGDLILEPNSTTRVGNCQACAKRHAGFKSWEILSVKITATQPVKTDVAIDPEVQKPGATTTAAIEQPSAVEKPVIIEPPVIDTKNTGKNAEVDGYKAEDGTIIPWDQLPAEFRPHKQN